MHTIILTFAHIKTNVDVYLLLLCMFCGARMYQSDYRDGKTISDQIVVTVRFVLCLLRDVRSSQFNKLSNMNGEF